MIYKNELERMKRELEERREDLERELLTLPEGMLLCTDENGKRRYYQRLAAVGNRKKERRYGVKTRPDMLDGLVRKKYVTEARKNIDRDLKIIEDACRRFVPIDELSVMEPYLSRWPELTEQIYREPIDLDAWKAAVKPIDNYHTENLRQTSADGSKRRSKNELYIASRLDHYGITYRWDCPTEIPGLRWAPDFTLLHKRTREKLYWEHMGMMSDPGYREHNKIKLADYEEAGIVPWNNLIITYDTDGGDMRADIIEAMIKVRLL